MRIHNASKGPGRLRNSRTGTIVLNDPVSIEQRTYRNMIEAVTIKHTEDEL